MDSQRLDSYLARNGVCSRRSAEHFLNEHLVTINGARVKKSGIRVKSTDDVRLEGATITSPELVYYMVHKSIGTVSTVSDEFGRKTVLSNIKSRERLHPVGRLDKNTTGLLILTNDGELTNLLTHPRYQAGKVYQLRVFGEVREKQLERMARGVRLKDGLTAPAEVKNIKKSGKITQFDLTLHEGRNRQVRRMCEAVGVHLQSLKRIQVGRLHLGDLREGARRKLTSEEITMLKTLPSNASV